MEAQEIKDYEEIKKQLTVLIEKNSYNLEKEHFDRLMNLYFYKEDIIYDHYWFSGNERSYYELACMLDILNKAKKNGSGFILKSKDTTEKIEVTNIQNVCYMHEFINRMLYDSRHDDYMNEEVFNWKERNFIYPYYTARYLENDTDSEINEINGGSKDEIKDYFKKNEDEDFLVPEPYNEAEMKLILKYEKRQLDNFSKVKNQRVSYYLHGIVEEFKKDGIFKNTKKTLSTKDACFLFDCLCLFELHQETTENKQDKYQYIKGVLNKLKDIDIHRKNRLLIP
jgi:hypothetical protein